MFAAHHRLSNLVAIVDLNGQQALGYTKDVLDLSPMAERWRAFGWDVHEVDGHDPVALADTIRGLDTEARPAARAGRAHDLRQGCLLHGEQHRVALPADDRRTVRAGHEGGGGVRATFIRTLVELAEEDERIVLLTGDLGFTVVEPFAERFPDRFFNVGVAEQNMVGVATGLAEAGFVPFVYSIATFATLRPYEFIRNGPVLHRLPVRIVGVGGGLEYGLNGLTHYALEDIAVMRAQPGMTVLAPADFEQARTALRETKAVPGPSTSGSARTRPRRCRASTVASGSTASSRSAPAATSRSSPPAPSRTRRPRPSSSSRARGGVRASSSPHA